VNGHELVGAYVLGVLDPDGQAAVRAHLDGCAPCRREVGGLREVEAALGEIPPEALLDGPPPGGDRVLQRLLSGVRDQSRPGARRRWWTGAAAVVVVVALGGGVLAGRLSAAPPAGSASASPGAAPGWSGAGVRTGAATEPRSGARMAVQVQPAAGWVRVRATVDGVPAGEQCRLYVVSADGGRRQAAGWQSGSGATTVDGAALMAPGEVTAVQAETYAGRILVVAVV
jgi:Putative zinc-finger